MKVKNVTANDMEKALSIVNAKYENNIEWNRFDTVGKQIHFTLRCKSSSGPGHRLSQSVTSKGNRRKLTSACWHVHGDFFDALIGEVNNEAIVTTGNNKKIFYQQDMVVGNWEDWNIGSMYYPLYYSDACDCE
jgi:hypothetical protein